MVELLSDTLSYTRESNLAIQMGIGIFTAIMLIIPLAFKWEIKQRVAFLSAVLFGLCSGIICYEINRVFPLTITQLFVMRGSTIFLMAFIGGMTMFYRDPERHSTEQLPNGKSPILSPADGTILYVKRIEKGKVPLATKKGRSFRIHELSGTDLLDNGAYLVGIGMNLLNVHVNRSPIKGTVRLARAINGLYLSLKVEDAVLRNERRTTVIDNDGYRVGVIQIASRLVRRIESYVSEGQTVAQGERIGIIHFGSQVDLVIPFCEHIDSVEVLIKPGDVVKAGESLIAAYFLETADLELEKEFKKTA